MPRTLRLAIALCGLTLAWTAVSTAEVPHVLNFQGRLKDSTGTPYTGSKLVKFSIYDSLGTEVWTSGFNSQTFSGGLVNVLLGAPPQPPLPTAAILGDTSLTLGITVDTDPEIVPRLPLVSSAWAIHAADADRVDGLEGASFVQEGGDTMSGSLAVLGNLSVGTDTSFTGLSVQSGSNWNWSIGDGWGDFRIGDDNVGFSIGIALGGGGTGHTRMWTRGGPAENITFGSVTSGDILNVWGTTGEVTTKSNMGIGTGVIVAPLTLQSQSRSRWDVGAGLGDMRLVNGAAGLSLGVSATGAASIWSSGGTGESITLGGPVGGSVLSVNGNPKLIWMRGATQWFDTAGDQRAIVSPGLGSLSVTSPEGGSVSMSAYDEGSILFRDSGSLAIAMDSRPFGGSIALYRRRPSGPEALGMFLEAGEDSTGSFLQLNDGLGSIKMTFDAANDGDASVVLPTDAINHDEILDEPGVAFNRRGSSIPTLDESNTSQDFLSVQITIPAAGYIVVDGVAYTDSHGDTSFAWVQISETSNRAAEIGQYNWIGSRGFGNSSADYAYQTTPVKRFYMKTKGTYTFYLQGNAYTGNGASSVSLLSPSWLQATYYPVSYGTASTLAESPEGFEQATPVAIADPQTGATSTVYRVDLRELELRAARARAEAEKAQRELLEERARQGILQAQRSADVDLVARATSAQSESR